MRVVDAQEVGHVLRFPELIKELRTAFAGLHGSPRRNVYRLVDDELSHDAFAVLPAWNEEFMGVKAFTYLPGNASRGRQILHAKILLFDRHTGEPQAVVDGTSVTYWRTAAIAALAADFLARRDAKRLLFCGTGNLAPYMILAHACVRNYEIIEVWGRRRDQVARTVTAVLESRPELPCFAAHDLEESAHAANVVSCATAARQPLIFGEWIRPGTHTDFSGNHEPNSRECDSDLVARSSVYADSSANVLNEAGEILIPLQEGSIAPPHLVGDLAQLCAGKVPGRQRETEITLFKSVGTALSDLVAAGLVFRTLECT